jgi:CheY-like chemotaxis protein
MRIAILDDYDDTREIFKLWLGDSHEVIEYSTAESFLNDLPKREFDLLLLDLKLPDVDGPTVARAIHAMMGENRPKIIAISAACTNKDIEEAREAGVDEFLAKPIDFPSVMDWIETGQPFPADRE